jgi:hypothetical protein
MTALKVGRKNSAAERSSTSGGANVLLDQFDLQRIRNRWQHGNDRVKVDCALQIIRLSILFPGQAGTSEFQSHRT